MHNSLSETPQTSSPIAEHRILVTSMDLLELDIIFSVFRLLKVICPYPHIISPAHVSIHHFGFLLFCSRVAGWDRSSSSFSSSFSFFSSFSSSLSENIFKPHFRRCLVCAYVQNGRFVMCVCFEEEKWKWEKQTWWLVSFPSTVGTIAKDVERKKDGSLLQTSSFL